MCRKDILARDCKNKNLVKKYLCSDFNQNGLKTSARTPGIYRYVYFSNWAKNEGVVGIGTHGQTNIHMFGQTDRRSE